ncbi:NACHT domain-containing protein [Streptomyces sp. NPDC102274]|uniref:NACHT domain-containing protein n=1 Tax=Streptomyces sp. NPDC102274 TaxID=3366151 RepID=UPI003828BDD2
MSGSADDPATLLAAKVKELVEMDGRSYDAIASAATKILDNRKDPRTGKIHRTSRPPRQVTKQRISDWTKRTTPAYEYLEAVVDAVSEHVKGRTNLTEDQRKKLIDLLDTEKWQSLWQSAKTAPRAEPWLKSYLDALLRTAEAHPYPGVLPDIPLPPLSQVYVQQRGRPRPAPDANSIAAGGDADPSPRPAVEAVLSADHDVLLLGGPGTGKSSLLRQVLITLAKRGTAPDITEIPIYVSAVDLTSEGLSFAEQLAAAVRHELSGRAVPSLPTDSFSRPPRPASRWLVLLDGLDEITDVRQRRRLAQLLGEYRSELYRFVLTSRPLPSDELGQLESDPQWRSRSYELLPFDPGQLRDFAERWMRTADLGPGRLPEPALAVNAFMAQVARPPLATLARTPLIATILCQLHAARPEQALPRDRYGIYYSFVDLLRERLLQALDPQSHDVLHEIMSTLRRVAVEHHADGVFPDLLTAVRNATEDLCPSEMRYPDWDAWRREVLRRTGLVAAHGETYTFVHQTIGEFLAAQHTADAPELSEPIYRGMYDQGGVGGSTRPPLGVQLSSFRLFLIGAWHSGPPLAPLPRGVPQHLTTHLAEFATSREHGSHVALLAGQGITLAPGIIEAAINTLTPLVTDTAAHNDHDRVRAAEDLAMLSAERGGELLASLATDTTVHAGSRYDAARALANLGDPRAADLLASVAADDGLLDDRRLEAAQELVRLSDQRGAGLLEALATNATAGDYYRVEAAQALAEMDTERGTALLASLALDTSLRQEPRFRAARALTKLNGERAVGVWAELVTIKMFPGDERIEAARALARLDRDQAALVWEQLMTDTTVLDHYRVEAAQERAELGDARGKDLLATLAYDPALHFVDRSELARTLRRLQDPRGNDLLASLAKYGVDPDWDDED